MEKEKYEIVKFVDNGFELEVNVSPEEDTVWLTQEQMAVLFQKSKSTINEHVKNSFEEGEVGSGAMIKFGKTEFSKKPTFDVHKSRISRHISNIFETNELNPVSTVAENAIVQTEGNRQIRRIVQLSMNTSKTSMPNQSEKNLQLFGNSEWFNLKEIE